MKASERVSFLWLPSCISRSVKWWLPASFLRLVGLFTQETSNLTWLDNELTIKDPRSCIEPISGSSEALQLRRPVKGRQGAITVPFESETAVTVLRSLFGSCLYLNWNMRAHRLTGSTVSLLTARIGMEWYRHDQYWDNDGYHDFCRTWKPKQKLRHIRINIHVTFDM